MLPTPSVAPLPMLPIFNVFASIIFGRGPILPLFLLPFRLSCLLLRPPRSLCCRPRYVLFTSVCAHPLGILPLRISSPFPLLPTPQLCCLLPMLLLLCCAQLFLLPYSALVYSTLTLLPTSLCICIFRYVLPLGCVAGSVPLFAPSPMLPLPISCVACPALFPLGSVAPPFLALGMLPSLSLSRFRLCCPVRLCFRGTGFCCPSVLLPLPRYPLLPTPSVCPHSPVLPTSL